VTSVFKNRKNSWILRNF